MVSNRPEPSPSIRTGLPGSTYRVFNKSIFMTEHRLAKTLEMLYVNITNTLVMLHV